ncbi:hypothetical protein KLP28_10925 [Nocardioidaceae bacterium]|nr:hypothetical protein KLP28_10925 [Nocardioidaceae bacterium]
MGDPRARLVRIVAVAVAVAVAPVLGPAVPAYAENDRARTEFTWPDERISESSGLAFAGDLLVTTNDSGDDAVLYAVDPDSGQLAGVTSYDVAAGLDPVDVEALAPTPRGEAVWVGDIGDNGRTRSTVVVHRVPIAAGDRTVAARSVVLAYPDGAHDAETLLSDPRTGRLHVVTKALFGGTVYAAPRDLSPYVADAEGRPASGEPGLLREVGRVPGFLTDGVLLPRGAGVLLRDYAGSTAYTWPELERLTPVGLPAMRQGEAVALRGGRLWASTEGVGTAVVSVPLPPVLRARLAGRDPAPASPTDDAEEGSVAEQPAYATEPGALPPWLVGLVPAGAGLIVVVALGALAALVLRRRRG